MKLDLLYEVDVPKPWDGPGTQGQRRSEQAAYAEALEQIVLADRYGFNTVWMGRYSPRRGRAWCSALVLYLASDASRFCTGQIWRANGGQTIPR